jgi:hypothetical protein
VAADAVAEVLPEHESTSDEPISEPQAAAEAIQGGDALQEAAESPPAEPAVSPEAATPDPESDEPEPSTQDADDADPSRAMTPEEEAQEQRRSRFRRWREGGKE